MSQIIEAARQMQVAPALHPSLVEVVAPADAVHALLRGKASRDALALALRLAPKPYAVAWLCQCARRHVLDAGDAEGLRLAQAWVQQPDEDHRRAALRFAAHDDYQTIGGWLAAAAGWSDGSLVEHDDAPQAADHLTATAAVAALLHLAARVPEYFDDALAGWAEEVARLLARPHDRERAA